MITLKGLQYSPTHADLYVDVWWLTRGLSVSDIQYLRGIQNSQAEHFCCYKEGGVGPVNKMMSGYARVIMYSDKHGIVVACGTHALKITQLQPQGKKPMAVTDFLNGRSDWVTPGSALGENNE